MDDKTIDKATYAQMASGDKKLMNKAERLLREGKSALIAKGFGENGGAKAIWKPFSWAESQRALWSTARTARYGSWEAQLIQIKSWSV
jgi:hypothetical protein